MERSYWDSWRIVRGACLVFLLLYLSTDIPWRWSGHAIGANVLYALAFAVATIGLQCVMIVDWSKSTLPWWRRAVEWIGALAAFGSLAFLANLVAHPNSSGRALHFAQIFASMRSVQGFHMFVPLTPMVILIPLLRHPSEWLMDRLGPSQREGPGKADALLVSGVIASAVAVHLFLTFRTLTLGLPRPSLVESIHRLPLAGLDRYVSFGLRLLWPIALGFWFVRVQSWTKDAWATVAVGGVASVCLAVGIMFFLTTQLWKSYAGASAYVIMHALVYAVGPIALVGAFRCAGPSKALDVVRRVGDGWITAFGVFTVAMILTRSQGVARLYTSMQIDFIDLGKSLTCVVVAILFAYYQPNLREAAGRLFHGFSHPFEDEPEPAR